MNNHTASLKSSSARPRASATRRSRGAKLLLAVPAAAAAAPAAHADITYTEINGGSGLSIGTSSDLYFNPVTGQAGAYTIGSFRLQFYFSNAGKPQIGSLYGTNAIVTDGSFVAKLASGTLIDSSDSFDQTSGKSLANGASGPWAGGDNGYVGLRLTPGSQTHYGWANITYDAGGTLTLFEMAYETTPNLGILTGAMPVPEPAETAALAALVAGSAAAFAARRKRRSAAL